MSKPIAKEILKGPHATFTAQMEQGYGKLSLCLYFDTPQVYGPGSMTLTAQVGTEYLESVKAAIIDSGKRSYAHRVELDFRNGATSERIKPLAKILARFERSLRDRNLGIEWSDYPTLAAALVHAAKLRYVFVNPVQEGGRRKFPAMSNVDDWHMLDMRDHTDTYGFGKMVGSSITRLWHCATPRSVMIEANQALGTGAYPLAA